MQAVVIEAWGGPEVLQVKETPIPEPGPGQVLIKIEYCGINPVETYIRNGTYAKKPSLPYVPGSDGAGTVEKVGADVTTVKQNDRVYLTGSVSGTYAQYALCDISSVQPLPESIGFDQGAAIGVAYRTAYRALFIRGKLKPGMSVLVHGASGGVGVAAVQLARSVGANVFGTAGTPAGLDMLRAMGATAYSHRTEGYMDDILADTASKGVDLIVEMLANVNLGHDLKVLAHGGCVAIVGSRGEVSVNPRDLMQREASVVGVMGGTPSEIAEGFAAINAGLRGGTLSPIVAPKKYGLGDVATAHVDVIDRKDPECQTGKLVIKMWQ